ncbi:MAG: asparagine synthase-related protein [Desulfatiglandales bacterium]
MTAIAGIISQHGKVDGDCTEHVRAMLRLMRHRGPDNTIIRTLFDDRGAVGANELNLTPQKTYGTALEENPYLLFDGELYREARNGESDIELFRRAYEKYGSECFRHLEGTYTCAVVEKDDEVILARDPVGSRPLFFGSDNSVFYFSTEMKGLAAHVKFNLQELPPGHVYSTKSGMKPFAPFSPRIPPFENLNQAAGVLRELLIEAVRKRMDGVGGISLSGGLDSSIVAAIAKEFNSHLHLFTGTIDKAPGPDLENAKVMAEFLGMEHHIYRITDSDIDSLLSDAIWYLESFDEDCISGFISNYCVSRMAKEYTNCVLVGEGADELFGGYRMVLKNPRVKNAEQRERLARRLLEISYNTALRRLDRAWMANGVLYETPFLDPAVVAFSRKIPMAWKIYGEKQVEKYVLREAFRGMLPDRIIDREKLRFSMGVGTDDVMDELVARKIEPREMEKRPKAAYGLPFASFKELFYYDEFLRFFPASYEKQTVRWDPFK